MKISETCAYIRAIGGVSGDMLLGALIHLGVDINFINNQLNSLDLGNIELGSCIGTRKGVEGIGLVPLIPDLQSKSFTFKEADGVDVERERTLVIGYYPIDNKIILFCLLKIAYGTAKTQCHRTPIP